MSAEMKSGEHTEAAAPVQNGQATHSKNEQEAGLLAALQAERAQRQSEQEQNRLMKEHLALLQANQQPQQRSPLDSLQPDDVITKRELDYAKQEMAQTLYQMQVMQKYPDYQEVVSQYLPEVIKQNPELQRSLETSNDYALAYHLAKSSDTYRNQNKSKQRNADAERILENSQKSGSLASMGASAPVSMAKSYKSMSDKEFKELMMKHVG
jgi:hypothetical protein